MLPVRRGDKQQRARVIEHLAVLGTTLSHPPRLERSLISKTSSAMLCSEA
jgi:hypothetical protein